MTEDEPTSSARAVVDPRVEIPAGTWEGCTESDLCRDWGLPRVHLFERVGSTNDVARALAQQGAAPGTLILSEEQVAGRGRGAKSWSSHPGVGLWCSLVLRDLSLSAIGTLPLRVALAIARTLDAWVPGEVRVKWPNDLLLGGRKLGGILCEAVWDGHTLNHIVVGIGLNLTQSPGDFPAEIRTVATSLRAHVRQPVSRFAVATAVLRDLRPLVFRIAGRDAAPLDDDFNERDVLRGRFVEIREPGTDRVLAAGTASGVDAEGALLVRHDGRLTAVRSGTVVTRETLR